MSFTFTLEAVLRSRKSIEEREQRKLEQIKQQLVQARSLLESLNTQLHDLAGSRESAMQQAVAAFQLHALEAARIALQRHQKEATAQLVRLHADWEKQLKLFAAARRDRKLVSEMRDRQREAYQTAQTRQQQKTIDDLFSALRKTR